MGPYVMAEDLYQFKLALILGRGKRLKKILKHYPTERKFKEASIKELASITGITNTGSKTLEKLIHLDTTYDKMVTFNPRPHWSKVPDAERIMGIDTEYLNSELDSIQYVVVDELEVLTSGFVFTNSALGDAVNRKKGINFLRKVINKYNPCIIVGHNFNSDISVMESAYGKPLPELYHYDDTMDLLQWSNLANIIGGKSLNKAVKNVFDGDVIGLFSAYNDPSLLVEYGLKDALYPVFLRHYIVNGNIPALDFNLEPDIILKEENRDYYSIEQIEFSLHL
uniref:Uncharacterized protein n=1 Tax=uncultured organism TaxID=155900 RepID=M1QBZ4_9ZZZZ|nr:hypothetical protein FLSS-28_0016 [uncultured organism]